MTINREQVKEFIKEYGSNDKDTGSPAVQIAILTARINALTEHLKNHVKDNHSRRGLLFMVSKRRSLLEYVKSNNPEEYLQLIEKLNIRK